MIIFKGWQKTSLMEYPDKISTVLFTGGCNFRCPYCYNSELVLRPDKLTSITEYEVIEYLERNKNMYQAVIITGGEPCMQKGLPDFFKKVKKMNLSAGLETNGSYPEVIKNLLDMKLIDYIAMDIKAPLLIEKYSIAAGISGSKEYLSSVIKRIQRSISVILQSGIKHEFRTTFTPEIHTPHDANLICNYLDSDYVLQCFVQKDTVLNNTLKKADTVFKDSLRNIYLKLKNNKNRLSIRNI